MTLEKGRLIDQAVCRKIVERCCSEYKASKGLLDVGEIETVSRGIAGLSRRWVPWFWMIRQLGKVMTKLDHFLVFRSSCLELWLLCRYVMSSRLAFCLC